VKKLEENNISAYCVAGWLWKNDDYGNKFQKLKHTWVEAVVGNTTIPIESITGEIITPEGSRDYNILRRGLCW
jgi:hypothetical protein